MEKFPLKLVAGHLTWRRSLLEAGLFLGVYITWLILRSPGSSSRSLVGSLAVVIPLATASLLLFSTRGHLAAPIRRSWVFMGFAWLCWFAGGLLRLYYVVFRGISMPAISLADGVNFLAYPLMSLALIFFPSGSRYLPSRFRFILDAAISSGVVVVLGWLVIARPLVQSAPGGLFQFLPLVYPMADLVLLTVLFNTLLSNPGARRTSLFWGGSLLAFLISDIVYSYQSLISGYQPGGWESIGWIVGGLVFCISVLVVPTPERDTPQGDPGPDLWTRLQNAMPVILVLVLIWFVLSDWRLRGTVSDFGLWTALLLSMGLIVRLGVRAGEVELFKYWQLFNGLPEPTFICDRQGMLLLANPAMERMMGERTTRPSLQDILVGDSHPGNLFAHGIDKPASLEVHLHNTDRTYLLSINPIITGEKKRNIAGVMYDISAQKGQQEALQKTYAELQTAWRQLEDLNTGLEAKVAERTTTLQIAYQQLEEQNIMLQAVDQLKSDFVSMVSHELRTPLTSLNGGLELILARPDRRPEDRLALQLMKKEVQRLTHFVENILNLSAMEAGRLEAQIEPVDLNLVIHDVLRSLSILPGAERLQIAIPADLPALLADESFLHSILTQLLDNALKYATTGAVLVEALRQGRKLRVQVTDAGPGIPPEKRRLLFGRFQRLDVHDSQAIYGYGLGLYLSRKLLLRMESDLHYAVPPGGGARFYFDLKVTP